MKKFFIMLVTFLLLLSFASCTTNQGQSGSSTGDDAVETITRDLYLTPFETYNLIEQLKYEGVDISNTYITDSDANQPISESLYESSNITITNGNIVPNHVETDDYTTDEVVIVAAETTITYKIHIVNHQKYGETLSYPDVGRLYGKKAIFFGDSITDQNAAWWETCTWTQITKDGQYVKENHRPVKVTGITKNYVNMLTETANLKKVYNPAVAGALCSHYNAAYANKSYSIPMQVKSNLDNIKDVDYVFVMGGTNDSYEINKRDSVLTLGSPDDLADETAFSDSVTNKPLSTFYGYYNYILKTIRETNERAGIICLSNIPCCSDYGYSGGVSNGHNNEGISGVNVAVENCAQAYNCCYVDIFSAVPFNEQHNQYLAIWFTNDLLHPHQVTYELITDKILSGK